MKARLLVIDASVAIKWFIPEVHSIKASSLLNKKNKFLAPDLIFAEIGNILWKKSRLKQLSSNIAGLILNDFKSMPFDIYENENLLESAWNIAINYNCTVYDSLYVALAKTERAKLVTADQALYNSLKTTSLKDHLLWIEDL